LDNLLWTNQQTVRPTNKKSKLTNTEIYITIIMAWNVQERHQWHWQSNIIMKQSNVSDVPPERDREDVAWDASAFSEGYILNRFWLILCVFLLLNIIYIFVMLLLKTNLWWCRKRARIRRHSSDVFFYYRRQSIRMMELDESVIKIKCFLINSFPIYTYNCEIVWETHRPVICY
jgi:hypothetical protein